ncbi:MAG: Dam family site-specific DNA-(adenine-N6)-methyltransferase [Bacteriovoracaceae bacterium]|jgi:DNA adenine methylase|nr:Dam family site-specific DNA-(adenine-N6)-methyltransferase [Bacteriovoracaceae bacterium]
MIENISETELLPFLKWAGGKRWLSSRDDTLLAIPEYNRYIEPFLGSGAMFFKESPRKAILNDLNQDLIVTYKALKEDWRKVYQVLKRYHKLHNKDFYYEIRASKPRTKFSIAAKFIYLNRTCFNGIYRVNLKGEFNVPIGTKTNVVLPTDDFNEISKLLNKAILKSGDFEPVINMAKEGDFLFVDPPYTVKHAYNGFVKYNEKLFSWEDQVRLKEALVRASDRGAFIMMTNAFHESIRKLYWGTGFSKAIVDRNSVVAASPEDRGVYSEYLITNY